MRIFVTGATGFIGAHFIERALDAGHAVTGLYRSDDPRRRPQDLVFQVRGARLVANLVFRGKLAALIVVGRTDRGALIDDSADPLPVNSGGAAVDDALYPLRDRGPHHVGGARVAAPYLVDIDPLGPRNPDREIDAPQEVGDDEGGEGLDAHQASL